MPRNGRVCSRHARTGAIRPRDWRLSIASWKAPSPGSTTASASSTTDGSSVTTAGMHAREGLLDAPEIAAPVVDDRDHDVGVPVRASLLDRGDPSRAYAVTSCSERASARLFDRGDPSRADTVTSCSEHVRAGNFGLWFGLFGPSALIGAASR